MSAATLLSAEERHPPLLPTSHCVFRSGNRWQALPAAAVREVMFIPDIVHVPGTPETFAGLCHVRHEFVPVLKLGALLTGCEQLPSFAHAERATASAPGAMASQLLTARSAPLQDRILLLLEDTDGTWGILAGEVTPLQTLDISDNPQYEGTSGTTAVMGWAKHGDQVIQVLDQRCIREMAQDDLAAFWKSFTPRPDN